MPAMFCKEYRKILRILKHIAVELGCSTDAISFLDEACSGKAACEYKVPGDDLYATQPCSKDYASYLEVHYQCIKGRLIFSHFSN